MADPATDAAIAASWPDAWARANNSELRGRSKARNNLRKRWSLHLKVEAIRKDSPSAKCASCKNSNLNPSMGIRGRYCELDSDFYGYQMVGEDYLCSRWIPS